MTADPVAPQAARRHWERNAWKYLLGFVVVVGLFGVGDIIAGADADPAIPVGVTGMTHDEIRLEHPLVARLVDLQVRSGGLHLVMLATVWSAVTVIPFRRHERWAWWAMWTYPAWAVSVAASFLFVELQPQTSPPPPAVSGWVLGVAAAALLVASPGRPMASSPQVVPSRGRASR